VSEQCLDREAADKTASGISVFLLEELGDARLRCAQLKKYLDEATTLVEKSEHRDHLFEIAAHLIHGIPATLVRMEQALNAAAMAAAKFDYEEIKDQLRPEKSDELERALEDVRVRRVRRQSTITKEARTTDNLVSSIAQETFREVMLPTLREKTKDALEQAVTDAMIAFARMRAGHKSGLMLQINRYKPSDELSLSDWVDQVEEAMEDWFSSAKRMLGGKFAAERAMKITEASAQLEHLASALEATGKLPVEPTMKLIAELEGLSKQASSRTETAEVLRKLSANLLQVTDEKPSRINLAATLRRILADGMDVTSIQMFSAIYQNASSREDVIKGFREANPSMSDADLEKAADHWEQNRNVVKDKQGTSPMTPVADHALRSRFEEGKPADPTQDMSPEDAKKWKDSNDEHKDNFKAASLKVAARAEIPLPYDSPVNVGKIVSLSGRAEYYYTLHNGAKMSYSDREKFRYQLRNQANVREAEKLVKELDDKVPSKTAAINEDNFKSAGFETLKIRNRMHGEGLTVDDFAGALNQAAENLYSCRGINRPLGQTLEDVMTGHIGRIGPMAGMPDNVVSAVKVARAEFQALENTIGQVASKLEVTARDLKRAKPADERYDRTANTLEDQLQLSRFEEGKPADPTEHMSPDDASKWKTEHDKHKDNFKAAKSIVPKAYDRQYSASSDPWKV
jgi:hypothetical protein